MKTTKYPKRKNKLSIAIVIATRNRPSSLIGLLESLHKQTYLPQQIIIASSSDKQFQEFERRVVKKVAFASRLVYFFVPHMNKAHSLNAALSKVRTPIGVIAFVDDDCIPPSDWIQKIKEFHELYPEVSILSGQCFSIQQSYLVRSYMAGITHVESRLIIAEYFFGANASVRVEKIPQLKFDERFNRCEDYEFVQRNKQQGAVALMDPSLIVQTTFPQGLVAHGLRLLQTGFYEYLVNEMYNAPAKDLYTPGKRFALLFTVFHLPVMFARSTISYFRRGQSAYLYPGYLLYEAIRVFGMLMALYKYRFQAPFRKRFAASNI